jgi:hypothetical protein
VQGRVPASADQAGHSFTCNLTEVGHTGTAGGFRVWRYIDRHGHECAFYDTALLAPLNAIRLDGPSLGVAVVDMSDPAHPKQTASLTELAMESPHESLNLNATRGLLAAVQGNPLTAPGNFAVYDVSQDCRHPVLDFSGPLARWGHESGFSTDGKTYYATGTGTKSITAIDLTDPKKPHVVWQGQEYSHGMSLSPDGDRAYIADAVGGDMLILDTSEIQDRKPNPQVREISRMTWKTATIPQNAIPIVVDGHRYVLEFDEYAFRFNGSTPPDTVGAARIIDIGDERHPRVVSNLRLAVNQPAEHRAAANDPGAFSSVQGYAAHYCNVPTRVDPTIVACSFIASGLRVFDIRDLRQPREAAYFVAPSRGEPENGFQASNFAMSQPAFAPGRREVWYSDGTSGMYVLRLSESAWPTSCPRATGSLAGPRLGPLSLEMTRALARRRLPNFTTRGRTDFDFYCLQGKRIRAGYPSPGLLRSLSAASRRRLSGRAVLLLATNRRYALRGVRFGTPLSVARQRLGLGRPLQIGVNSWYLVPGRAATGVLRVRGGQVREVGLADRRLTATRAAARRLLSSFR